MDAETQKKMFPGLPDGIAVVDFRNPRPEDKYEFAGGAITKPRGLAVGVIVEPAEGYEFRYRLSQDDYIPVKVFPALNAKVIIALSVTNTYDADLWEAFVASARALPGFVSAEVDPPSDLLKIE